jgi:hypothetical protein
VKKLTENRTGKMGVIGVGFGKKMGMIGEVGWVVEDVCGVKRDGGKCGKNGWAGEGQGVRFMRRELVLGNILG